jgi:SGNH hydrolase-like domain, acetyltransferase AlgX
MMPTAAMPQPSEVSRGARQARASKGRITTLRLIAAWMLGLGLLAGVGLVGAELLLRADPGLMPEAAQLRVHWRALGEQSPSLGDRELGFVYPPHLDGELRYRDFGFTYATDEHGFRNPSPWPTHADVVVLGDSQAFGYGVEADHAWWQLVANGLPDRKVVNLGLIGAVPQQYKRVFEAFGAELRPEVVLMALFPAYALTAVGQFDAWLAAGSPGNYDSWRSTADLPGWKGALKRLLDRSYLWYTLRAFQAEWRSGKQSRTLTMADGSELKLAPIVYQQAMPRARPEDAHFERVLDIIDEVRAPARANGSELMVVLIPTKEEVHLPLLGIPTAPFTASFATALAARGVPVVDTTPRFRERAARGERLFFTLDVHPNPAGQRLIADLVLDALRSRSDAGAASAKP